MNNGLHGRYLMQLEAWNEARELACELVEAFNQNSLSDVVSEWSETMNFPSLSEIKKLLTNVLFLDGRDTIDTIARTAMDWKLVETPDSMNTKTKVKV